MVHDRESGEIVWNKMETEILRHHFEKIHCDSEQDIRPMRKEMQNALR